MTAHGRNQFPSSREELEWEIEELQSEIARHHRDFERIRSILDAHSEGGRIRRDGMAHITLREIRNIVG